jgi:hypothetical protein
MSHRDLLSGTASAVVAACGLVIGAHAAQQSPNTSRLPASKACPGTPAATPFDTGRGNARRAAPISPNRDSSCRLRPPYLFAYQYLMWQFSQAWLMPSPTSRSLSLSFASMACSTGSTLSCRSSAIFVKLARSSLISASI